MWTKWYKYKGYGKVTGHELGLLLQIEVNNNGTIEVVEELVNETNVNIKFGNKNTDYYISRSRYKIPPGYKVLLEGVKEID